MKNANINNMMKAYEKAMQTSMQTRLLETAQGTRPAISCPAGRPVCVDSGRPAG
jgi:hypothetical protein